MKKRIAILLAVCAIIVVSISIFAITTGATGTTPELSIDYCNLSFRDSVCIKYAVSSNVTDVKLLIWMEPQEKYTEGTQDHELTTFYTEEIEGESYMIFDFTSLSAKQMTDVVYACAYAEVDGEGYFSPVNKYSILQYAYNKLGKTGTATKDEELKEMLIHMLDYGAAAQKYLDDYKVDRLANANWYQIKVEGGALDDGCTQGLYLPGDKVIITAPETNGEGGTFAYWKDARGNKSGTETKLEITVGNANQTYSPVYIRYSVGFEFDSNGDGTCYIIGKGDCIDADLVIPPVSPDGDKVIGIDNSSFAGEGITSVYLPATIEEIGRRAFNGCDLLTDVYYDGTEEEWNEKVNVSSGNLAIENATKHFYLPAVTTYTVTFLDYDGTVLKTEAVEEGADATAPTDPAREGYTFTGWNKSFKNVTGDITVTAVYKSDSAETIITVETVNVSKGAEEVTLLLSIENNPGIIGAVLSMNVDDEVFAFKSATIGDAFATNVLTAPGSANTKSPYNFVFDGVDIDADDIKDGVIMSLVLTVKDTSAEGSFDVEFSYIDGDITDYNLNSVDVEIINGKINIE